MSITAGQARIRGTCDRGLAVGLGAGPRRAGSVTAARGPDSRHRGDRPALQICRWTVRHCGSRATMLELRARPAIRLARLARRPGHAFHGKARRGRKPEARLRSVRGRRRPRPARPRDRGLALASEARLAGLDLAKLAAVAKPWVALPEGLDRCRAAPRASSAATGAGDALATAGADVALDDARFRRRSGRARRRKALPVRSGSTRLRTGRDRLPTRGRARRWRPARPTATRCSWISARTAPELDFAGVLDTAKARFEASTFTLDHAT